MSECCKACGSIDLQETIMDHGPHYSRIDCSDCGKFVKWGKKPVTTENENKHKGGREGMNKVILLGRLTKDPELRYTNNNNTAVCSFTLAVDRRFKQEGGTEADFFPVVAWQKTAEFCSKYFAKGRKVAVSGRLETRNWDDTEGKKHYVTEIIAEEVDFADSKKEDGAGSQQQKPAQQVPPENDPFQQQNRGSNQQGGYQPPAGPPPQGQAPGGQFPWG